MLSLASAQPKRSTYTDDLSHGRDERVFFGSDSQMELAVSWSGRERAFDIVEFCREEIVVSGFRVDDLDLCLHEACLDFCDGELMDEVTCHVAFQGFEGPGIARLRIVTRGRERLDIARFTTMLRSRLERQRARHDARLAVACGWL